VLGIGVQVAESEGGAVEFVLWVGHVALFTHNMEMCLRVACRLLGLCHLVDTGAAGASHPRRHEQKTHARRNRPNYDISREASGMSLRASER